MAINSQRFLEYEFKYESTEFEDLDKEHQELAQAFRNRSSTTVKKFLVLLNKYKDTSEYKDAPKALKDLLEGPNIDQRGERVANFIQQMSLQQVCAFVTHYKKETDEDLHWALQYLVMDKLQFNEEFNTAYENKNTKMRGLTQKGYVLAKPMAKKAGNNSRSKLKIDFDRSAQNTEGETYRPKMYVTVSSSNQPVSVIRYSNKDYQAIAIGGDALYHPNKATFTEMLAKYPGIRAFIAVGSFNRKNRAMPIGSIAPEHTPIGVHETSYGETPFIRLPVASRPLTRTIIFPDKSRSTFGPLLSTPDQGVVLTQNDLNELRSKKPVHAAKKPWEYTNLIYPTIRTAIGLPSTKGGYITLLATPESDQSSSGYTGDKWAETIYRILNGNSFAIAGSSDSYARLGTVDTNGQVHTVVSHYEVPSSTFIAIVPRGESERGYRVIGTDKVSSKRLPLDVTNVRQQIDIESLFDGLLSTSEEVPSGEQRIFRIVLGLPGSGKTVLMEKFISDEDHKIPHGAVLIDANNLQQLIPESSRLLKKDPDQLIKMTSSADLVGTLLDLGNKKRRHIVLHSAAHNVGTIVNTIKKQKQEDCRVEIYLLATNKVISDADAICGYEENMLLHKRAKRIDPERYSDSYTNLSLIVTTCQQRGLSYQVVVTDRDNDHKRVYAAGEQITLQKLEAFHNLPFRGEASDLGRYSNAMFGQFLRDASDDERNKFKEAALKALKIILMSSILPEQLEALKDEIDPFVLSNFEKLETAARQRAEETKVTKNAACETAISPFLLMGAIGKVPPNIDSLFRLIESDPSYLAPDKFLVHLRILNNVYKEVLSGESTYLENMPDEEKEEISETLKLRLSDIADIYFLAIHPRVMRAERSKEKKLEALSDFSKIFESIKDNDCYEDAQELITLGSDKLTRELTIENESRLKDLTALLDANNFSGNDLQRFQEIQIQYLSPDNLFQLVRNLNKARRIISNEQSPEGLALLDGKANEAAAFYKASIHFSIKKIDEEPSANVARLINFLVAFYRYPAPSDEIRSVCELITKEIDSLLPEALPNLNIKDQIAWITQLKSIGTADTRTLADRLTSQLLPMKFLKAFREDIISEHYAIQLFTSTLLPFMQTMPLPRKVEVSSMLLKGFSNQLEDNEEEVRKSLIDGLSGIQHHAFQETNPIHLLVIMNDRHGSNQRSNQEERLSKVFGKFFLSDNFRASQIQDRDLKNWRQFADKNDPTGLAELNRQLSEKENRARVFEQEKFENKWAEVQALHKKTRSNAERARNWGQWRNNNDPAVTDHSGRILIWALENKRNIASLNYGVTKNEVVMQLREERKTLEKQLLRELVQNVIHRWHPDLERPPIEAALARRPTDLSQNPYFRGGGSSLTDEGRAPPSLTEETVDPSEVASEGQRAPSRAGIGESAANAPAPPALKTQHRSDVSSFITSVSKALRAKPDSQESIDATMDASKALKSIKERRPEWTTAELADNPRWHTALAEKIKKKFHEFEQKLTLVTSPKWELKFNDSFNRAIQHFKMSQAEQEKAAIELFNFEGEDFIGKDAATDFIFKAMNSLALLRGEGHTIEDNSLAGLSQLLVTDGRQFLADIILKDISTDIEDVLLNGRENPSTKLIYHPPINSSFDDTEPLPEKYQIGLFNKFVQGCKAENDKNAIVAAAEYIDYQIKCFLGNEEAVDILNHYVRRNIDFLNILMVQNEIEVSEIDAQVTEFSQRMSSSLSSQHEADYLTALEVHLSDNSRSADEWWNKHCSQCPEKDKAAVLNMRAYYDVYPEEFKPNQNKTNANILKNKVRSNASKFIRQKLLEERGSISAYVNGVFEWTGTEIETLDKGKGKLVETTVSPEKQAYINIVTWLSSPFSAEATQNQDAIIELMRQRIFDIHDGNVDMYSPADLSTWQGKVASQIPGLSKSDFDMLNPLCNHIASGLALPDNLEEARLQALLIYQTAVDNVIAQESSQAVGSGISENPAPDVSMSVEEFAQHLIRYSSLQHEEKESERMNDELMGQLSTLITQMDSDELFEQLVAQENWQRFIDPQVQISIDQGSLVFLKDAIISFPQTLEAIQPKTKAYKKLQRQHPELSEPEIRREVALNRTVANISALTTDKARENFKKLLQACMTSSPYIEPSSNESLDNFRERVSRALKKKKTSEYVEALIPKLGLIKPVNIFLDSYKMQIENLTGASIPPDKKIAIPEALSKRDKYKFLYSAQLLSLTIQGWTQLRDSEKANCKKRVDQELLTLFEFVHEKDISNHFTYNPQPVTVKETLTGGLVVKLIEDGSAIIRRPEQSATLRFAKMTRELQKELGIWPLAVGKEVPAPKKLLGKSARIAVKTART